MNSNNSSNNREISQLPLFLCPAGHKRLKNVLISAVEKRFQRKIGSAQCLRFLNSYVPSVLWHRGMLYAKIFIPSKVNITSMQTSSKLKVITVIFLITGFIFISVNFISPHTILVEKTVQVPHQISIPIESHIDSMHFSFLDRNYRYFPAVSANAG